MSANSSIEWTDHTFNPWWGCTKISSGCKNCYAADIAHRFKKAEWGPNGTRPVSSSEVWEQPVKWDRQACKAGRPALVFCGSMCDIFEDIPLPEVKTARNALFSLIHSTPHLIWLLLTKRPENIRRMVPGGSDNPCASHVDASWLMCPPKNVMYLTSVEDQASADARIEQLATTPAAMRGLSVEPLLERVFLNIARFVPRWRGHPEEFKLGPGLVDWVIVGGESGPKARRCAYQWIHSIVGQCWHAKVPCFVKQLGSKHVILDEHGNLCDDSYKGNDFDTWPEEIRVREFPKNFRRRHNPQLSATDPAQNREATNK